MGARPCRPIRWVGKDHQAHGVIAAVNSETIADVTTANRSGFGDKPILIIVPLTSISDWAEDFRKTLGSQFKLHEYLQGKPMFRRKQLLGMTARDIIITTIGFFNLKHGPSAIEKSHGNKSGRPTMYEGGYGENELTDCFSLLILDEAHEFKSVKSTYFKAVRNSRAQHRMLLTGTPIHNDLRDLEGVMGVLQSHDVWDRFLQHDRKKDHFDIADESVRNTLIYTSEGAAWIKTKQYPGDDDKGKLIRQTYKACLLRRTYATTIEGKRVADELPPHKKVTVHLRYTGQSKDMAAVIRNKYMSGEKQSFGEAKNFRYLCHAATFLGLAGIQKLLGTCQRLQKADFG
ncbi:hypothetical protein HYALB_00012916 [Hymenoscyphus albidus]|uniref:Helicase ATP-binding domain-containing protein n=1 Tax=Hymenoscyphus albidus TaxID=595503 RepID=A0A9N9LPT2_9HELO|nr:hypothetical protein HYALB_00012916 [Hymenoscyphus albidus]